MGGRGWKLAVGVVAVGWRLFEEVRFRRQRPSEDRFVPTAAGTAIGLLAELDAGACYGKSPFVRVYPTAIEPFDLFSPRTSAQAREAFDTVLGWIEDRERRDGHELELLAGHARRTMPVYVEPSEPAPKCPECGAPVGAPCQSWCTSRGRRHITVVQVLTNPYREPPYVEWPRRGEAS